MNARGSKTARAPSGPDSGRETARAFAYRAIGSDGQPTRGTVTARDRADAARSLRERGALPVEIVATSSLTALPRTMRLLPDRTLARLFRGLGALITAGLPLDAALAALQAGERDAAARSLLRGLVDAVRAGKPLSVALSAEPLPCAPWVAAAIRAAEGSGSLGRAATEIGEQLARSARIAERVRSASTYPAIVLVLAIGTIAVLVGLVLPALAPLTEPARDRLSGMARFVLDASAWLRQWGALLLASMLAAGLLAARAGGGAGSASRAARIARLPVLGQVVRSLAVGRLARTLATLLGAGVPLAEAASLAAGAIGDRALAVAVLRARDGLLEGSSFSAALAQSGTLPPVALAMIETGERAGRLQAMLGDLAKLAEEDAERALDRAIALLVPLLTLALGGLVAAIVGATLSAMMGANAAALGGR